MVFPFLLCSSSSIHFSLREFSFSFLIIFFNSPFSYFASSEFPAIFIFHLSSTTFNVSLDIQLGPFFFSFLGTVLSAIYLKVSFSSFHISSEFLDCIFIVASFCLISFLYSGILSMYSFKPFFACLFQLYSCCGCEEFVVRLAVSIWSVFTDWKTLLHRLLPKQTTIRVCKSFVILQNILHFPQNIHYKKQL